jgi:predicted ABC-type ATPase
MTQTAPRRLRMFAGPNGSGKTSLVRDLARDFSPAGVFQLHRFINADDLFRDLYEGRGIPLDFLGRSVETEEIRSVIAGGGRLGPAHSFLATARIVDSRLTAPASACDGYVAAAVADFLHSELLAAGQSFSFETVMSHPSKVALFARARAAGYRTYLYFIATESSDLNVLRVKNRFALGGHDVPEGKIAERYERCLELAGQALVHAHRAFLFDNSSSQPVWLAELTPEGELQLKVSVDSLPVWFQKWVAPHYPGCGIPAEDGGLTL